MGHFISTHTLGEFIHSQFVYSFQINLLRVKFQSKNKLLETYFNNMFVEIYARPSHIYFCGCVTSVSGDTNCLTTRLISLSFSRLQDCRRTNPHYNIMMTSSNGKIFHVTGPFTGHRWIPLTKASDPEFLFSLICVWTNGWVNNRVTGDFRRDRAHYDVTVMIFFLQSHSMSRPWGQSMGCLSLVYSVWSVHHTWYIA